jgi:flagellar motor switch protein FliG
MLGLKVVLDKPLKVLEQSFVQDVLFSGSRNSADLIYTQVARIINKMERKHMDEVLDSIAQYSPKEIERIRELLFTFEDLLKLDQVGLVALFDGVAPEIITSALSGADPTLSERILAAVPSRMKRMIEQEIASGKRPLTKEVNKARRAIADLALQMIERGAIELGVPEEE